MYRALRFSHWLENAIKHGISVDSARRPLEIELENAHTNAEFGSDVTPADGPGPRTGIRLRIRHPPPRRTRPTYSTRLKQLLRGTSRRWNLPGQTVRGCAAMITIPRGGFRQDETSLIVDGRNRSPARYPSPISGRTQRIEL